MGAKSETSLNSERSMQLCLTAVSDLVTSTFVKTCAEKTDLWKKALSSYVQIIAEPAFQDF